MKKLLVKNDQFYTNPSVAKTCIKEVREIIPFSFFDTIIEPSAGTGSFSNNIKNCLAFDIEPKLDKIIKQDFLKLNYDPKWKNKIIFIGNPPFGKRSSLAKAFIKHCIKLNASVIAFILPNTFKKSINQKFNLFPQDWKLVKIVDLKDNAFYIQDSDNPSITQSYHVPCSFFVWTKSNLTKKIKSLSDLRKCNKLLQPKEWSFLKRGDQSADFTINGNSGKVKTLSEITNPKAEHYIKVNTKLISVSQAKQIFNNLKYNTNSSVNGGNYWINRQDIIEAWISQLHNLL